MKKLITFALMVAFLGAVGVSSVGCGDEKKKDTPKAADKPKDNPVDKGKGDATPK